jgi:hypothetical protein
MCLEEKRHKRCRRADREPGVPLFQALSLRGLAVARPVEAAKLGQVVPIVPRLRSTALMRSAPLAPSRMPSGTSLSSLKSAFVSVGISGVPSTGLPRSSRMVLQTVSMSSFAVPIASAGSDSIESLIR